jgi:hypothetical protein
MDVTSGSIFLLLWHILFMFFFSFFYSGSVTYLFVQRSNLLPFSSELNQFFFIIKLNYFKKWNQGRVIKLSVSPCRVKNESISIVALVGEGPKPTVEESSSQIIVFNSLSNHQSPIIFNN